MPNKARSSIKRSSDSVWIGGSEIRPFAKNGASVHDRGAVQLGPWYVPSGKYERGEFRGLDELRKKHRLVDSKRK